MAGASQPFTATTQSTTYLWNYDPQPKDNTPVLGLESPTTPSTLSPGSPRTSFATNRKDQLYSEVRKTMVEPLLQDEAHSKPGMIDNPLYDFTKSKDKLPFKREQELFKVSRKNSQPFLIKTFLSPSYKRPMATNLASNNSPTFHCPHTQIFLIL
ncbi:hypothetical protein E2320_001405, partial [Naja naja]